MSATITLKELSKILGVSISTVSKALNDSHEISTETKARIRETAKLYNYQPNKIAMNLKSGKTDTIGVIIPNIQNYFFAEVLFGIEKVIADSDYHIIVSITNESLDKEVSAIDTFSNSLVDGFIVALAEETQVHKEFSHFHKVARLKKPMVMFDRVIKNFNCDKVLVNDDQVLFDTTKKLLASERKEIVLATTIQNLSVGKSRAKGYLNAMENGVQLEGTSETIGMLIEKQLISRPTDAIIALDEDASLAAIRVAKKLHKKIPKELAIIGYASEKTASNLTPRLTTLNQQGISIGEKAACMLLNKLRMGVSEITSEKVETTLVQRQTS
ncbi:MAG: LacI family DNA-binding transcriptional regulator [Flavobacteriaceae bacterium]|nr:MAG: LacI family DNA-binding transcriptional regulator [Flavobacteriaceae bacterium]